MKHISHLDVKIFSTKQFDAFQFLCQHGQMFPLSKEENDYTPNQNLKHILFSCTPFSIRAILNENGPELDEVVLSYMTYWKNIHERGPSYLLYIGNYSLIDVVKQYET